MEVIEAKLPVRVTSELGRKEFMLVSLIDGADGKIALPSTKGSGSVTSFFAGGRLHRSRCACRFGGCG